MRSPGTVAIALLLLSPSAVAAAATCTEQDARGGGARPELSGPTTSLDSEDGAFRIHWTAAGEDAPTAMADADANGRPDFADRIFAGLAAAQTSYADQGWRPVAPDDGAGDSDAIDVYVRAIDANGYAFHAPPELGSEAASSCTMHLEASLGASLAGVLESVAAHELHHCVQYAYTTDAPSWLLEATATHQQYLVISSPALQAALDILWITRLSQPERPVGDLGGRFEYAGFAFDFFWESFDGFEPERLPALWEALRAAEAGWISTLDAESERLWGQPFTATYLDFATWNAFACARDDGAHYDSARFPCTLDTSVPVAAPAGDLLIDLPATRYAAGYASWPSEGEVRPIELSCRGPGEAGARAQVRLVALDRFLRTAEVVTVTGRGGDPFTVRLDAPVDVAGSVLAVVASTGSDPVIVDCTSARVDALAPPAEPPAEDAGCRCSGEGAAGASLTCLGLAVLPKRRRRQLS